MSGEVVNYFELDGDGPNFEELAIENGANLWHEADLMKVLGYSSPDAFRNVIVKAQKACLSIGISFEDSFIKSGKNYKLTRFACYLIAMHGDDSKPQIAVARVYFASLADLFLTAREQANAIDRVTIRDELKDGEKSLYSTASRHGVSNYACFADAGYRGMYNMSLKQLKLVKGLPAGENSLLDRMGKTELAANLFRITQTDEKIKNDRVQGQIGLEWVARQVGEKVRESMVKISGKAPEALPLEDHVKDVKKKLKGANKDFLKADKKKKEAPKQIEAEEAKDQDESSTH